MIGAVHSPKAGRFTVLERPVQIECRAPEGAGQPRAAERAQALARRLAYVRRRSEQLDCKSETVNLRDGLRCIKRFAGAPAKIRPVAASLPCRN